MNDSVSKSSTGQPDALRRRLAKSGLAAPVILATLASKPVLATAVPWNCTISGQLSGNMSGHEGETCTALGDSQIVLAGQYAEPAKKDLVLINVFPGLTNYFFFDGTNLSSSSAGNSAATIAKILSQSAPVGLVYAQKAVVLLLNAKHSTDASLNYPLTEYQARQLYEAAATNAVFHDTDPDPSWSPSQVQQYIDLLWRPA